MNIRFHSFKTSSSIIHIAEHTTVRKLHAELVPPSQNLPVLPNSDDAAVVSPPAIMAAPVGDDARARRVRAHHDAAVDLLLYTTIDIAPDPARGVVDGRRLQVDPPAQAAGADAGRDLLGALRGRRVVDGAVAARGVAVASGLYTVRVDSGSAFWGRTVGAVVVNVEDVEGMDVAWDVPVCSLWLAVGRDRHWLGRMVW